MKDLRNNLTSEQNSWSFARPDIENDLGRTAGTFNKDDDLFSILQAKTINS